MDVAMDMDIGMEIDTGKDLWMLAWIKNPK